MNLRHAAALALVGWYLMVPPMGPPMQYYINPAKAAEAPLSEWIHAPNDSFGSRQDCEAQLAQDKDATAAALRARPERDFPGSYAHRVVFAQCVFADDPRLKEK